MITQISRKECPEAAPGQHTKFTNGEISSKKLPCVNRHEELQPFEFLVVHKDPGRSMTPV
eukprot:134481-Amphidinium_carterae.2